MFEVEGLGWDGEWCLTQFKFPYHNKNYGVQFGVGWGVQDRPLGSARCVGGLWEGNSQEILPQRHPQHIYKSTPRGE